MMSDLKEKLIESGCSSEFIIDALRYEKLYVGDIDDFIDTVEDILMSDDDYEDALEDEDDDIDEDENDPIYQSDYNYDGNEDNIYFEDEDGEEALEDDEEEDDY
jgi:DNA-directed RNA polymerase subunit delta